MRFFPNVVPSAARGEEVYDAQCVECHGESGRGDGPVARGPMRPKPPDFTDEAYVREQTPAGFYEAVTDGAFGSSMLAFEDALCYDERWDVTFYSWSFATSDGAIEAGERLYGQECAGCHGASGQGDGPQVETLDVRPSDFTDPRWMVGESSRDLFAAISGEGPATLEHSWQTTLSEEERWQIVDYLWTFIYRR